MIRAMIRALSKCAATSRAASSSSHPVLTRSCFPVLAEDRYVHHTLPRRYSRIHQCTRPVQKRYTKNEGRRKCLYRPTKFVVEQGFPKAKVASSTLAGGAGK